MRDQQLAHRMLSSPVLDDNMPCSKLHAPRIISKTIVLSYTSPYTPQNRWFVARHW
jgi:hypothetical protein